MSFKINEIKNNTSAKLFFKGALDEVVGCVIDSRILKEGELFIAIEGENFDGHNFVYEAIEKKAACLVLDKNKINDNLKKIIKEKKINCFLSENTTHFLGELASLNRNRINAKIISITGSSGKTTVKEMTKNIFKTKFEIIASEKSFNNEIGLPLTLLKLNKNHQFAISEIGMNHLKEIEKLSKIAKPDIALITNVGTAHIGLLGSTDNIAIAKSEIFKGLKQDGLAILNFDDEKTDSIKRKIKQKHISFGFSKQADIRCENVKMMGLNSSFSLLLPNGIKEKINLNAPGDFMISNSLAAATIAYSCGISIKDIKYGLENFSSVDKRLQINTVKKGFMLINDTYNANPNSMKAAISILKNLKKEKKSYLILGDMLELGEQSENLHQEIGQKAGEANFTMIYATGAFANNVKKGALIAGVKKKNIFIGSKIEIFENIKNKLDKNSLVLVKGSRGMKMETIVEKLIIQGS